MRNIAFVLLTACVPPAGPEPESLAPRQDAMINGAAPHAPIDDAVVALLTRSGTDSYAPFCTGALIAPRVVLTAAHCITSDFVTPGRGVVFFGDELNGPLTSFGELVDVVDTLAHPGWNQSGHSHHDIALLELAEEPAGITPIPTLPADLALTAADEGVSVRFCGFGKTENGYLPDATRSMQHKLQFAADILEVCNQQDPCTDTVPFAFTYDHTEGGPCYGDSGGPAFLDRNGQTYVAGVNSTVHAAVWDRDPTQLDCREGISGADIIVDQYQTFIVTFANDRGLQINPDPCSADTHTCDATATCSSPAPWTFECTCPSGFSGDGTTCTDIDECSGSPCNPLATCTNTAGSFECSACPTGYHGDGTRCEDRDECDLGEHDCVGACDNLPGSYRCAGEGLENRDAIVAASCRSVPSPWWALALLLVWRRLQVL